MTKVGRKLLSNHGYHPSEGSGDEMREDQMEGLSFLIFKLL